MAIYLWKIILKYFLDIHWNLMLYTGCVWLRIGTSDRLL